MNSDQLRYLIELRKNPSITAASTKLHITPQALSIAIKKLEDELGFTLLNRSFKGVSFTNDGEWLVQEAESFLSKIDVRKMFYQTKQENYHSGKLDITINYSDINNTFLSQLICKLYEQEPDLKITLREEAKMVILSQILSDQLDFGFTFRTKLNGVYTDTLTPELNFESLLCGELVLNVSENSELAKFQSITMKKAVQHPLCAYSPHKEGFDLLQNFIIDGCNQPVYIEPENNYSIYREKIIRGIANSLCVYFFVDNSPSTFIEGTKIIHLRDDIEIHFGVLKKKDTVLSENAMFFIHELKTLIQDKKKPKI